VKGRVLIAVPIINQNIGAKSMKLISTSCVYSCMYIYLKFI
jgi:hypothetical protein